MAALEAILGETLLSGDGEKSTSEALKGKAAIILYFSAHWCPPCKSFTPVFADAYKEWRTSGKEQNAEVVFVSWDRDDAAFQSYFGEMPWLAVPYASPLREGLGAKFKVEGIPGVVILGPDGTRLHGDEVDGRQMVSQHKAKAFPFTKAHVEQIAAEAAKERAEALSTIMACSLDKDVTLGSICGKDSYTMLLYGDGDHTDGTYKSVADVIQEVRADGVKLEFVYVAWSLYNDECDHEKTLQLFGSWKAIRDLEAQVSGSSVKALLQKLPASVSAPHILLLKSDSEGKVSIDSDHPGCRAVLQYKAAGFPWSQEHIKELEAMEQARLESLRLKLKSLEFLKSDGDSLLGGEGKEVKVDEVAAIGDDAVIGIYFSAHWCPPCRGFTPKLAACYKELKDSGKKFEVVFVSGDRDEDAFKEYFGEMPWLALPFEKRTLKSDLNKLFEVQGIPNLVLLKPDGSEISRSGTEAINFGAEFFPWGPEEMEKGRAAAQEKAAKEKERAIKAENDAVTQQKEEGLPVVSRVRGAPGKALTHDVSARRITFNAFATANAPDIRATSGVLYYEIAVEAADGIPQFGFALESFERQDGYSGEGVGDDKTSWGADGVRNLLWHGSETTPWQSSWAVGDVLGFAANIDKGAIAVSKNGSWSDECQGLIFKDDKIKEGVYPCLTASGYTIVYNMDGDKHGAFKHGPPPPELWDGDVPEFVAE